MSNDVFNELKSHYFSSIHSHMNKCLEKSMQCPNKAINAHSIQKARVLDLLCQNGHVVQCILKVSGDVPPILEYELIGRNQATTFTGLCSDHDSKIFKEIDTKDLDYNNQQQMFLLAYRSLLRELYTVIDGANSILKIYQKRVELGLDAMDELSLACIEGSYRMMKAWRIYRYKCKYDDIEENELYGQLVHYTRVIGTDRPTVAASVFFGLGKYSGQEDMIGVILNIIPIEVSRTLITFSYLKEHESNFMAEFPELFSVDDNIFNSIVSKTLLKYGENFVLSPSYFDNWPQEKKEKISEYFFTTMQYIDHEEESEHLYLF